MERAELLRSLEGKTFDLIVVGAGINGCGIARDASMRGLRVLVVDKGDIASGTTQWATRLIHGGLRYLEHYEVPLVRESLRDREIMLHTSPHLVKPLKFVVPIYDRSSRGPKMIRLGMIGYDVLSYDKSVPNHRMLSREEALSEYPGLNPDGLQAAATYYDAQVEYAERVAVENAISAVENGATVITYAGVRDLIFENGRSKVVGVEIEDNIDGGTYTVRAPVTINVAGPWVDRVLGGSGSVSLEAGSENPGDDGRMIGGTKGSHIVVDEFPGAPKTAIYVEARKDGRPYFIVPWNGSYLIGTTDFRYKEDLDYVKATEDEIQYLIDETNYVIPTAGLTRDSVLFTYSGVRPLPSAPSGSEGSISRSHVVFDHSTGKSAAGGRMKVQSGGPNADGLLSIIGGKLTTYRNLGRQATNVVYKKLGVYKPPKSATDRVPLPGGKTADLDRFANEFRLRSDLSDVQSRRLIRLYGARAYDVLSEAGDDESLKTPLTDHPKVSTALMGCEVLYAFRREMATKLADVLLRRTMVSYGSEVALDVDEAAARVCVEHLGWSEDRAKREVDEYREWITRYTPKAYRDGDVVLAGNSGS